ncbi:Serine/threonine-protein kinase ppk30 [Colletotrichum sp. SAR11_239]|nr:Serine/threonine-protein kinase ppk30 [Colletotrichum sp. SAR11_239]
MPAPVPTAPAGTFAPGTKIQVGNHRVVIQKYLSEGGFAHVYLVKLPKPIDGTDMAVLKRVAVPDKEALRSMRTEVETMKRLKGHRPIVTYIDSHASEMRGGGYEVFLLMEFCDGGGLIDFMNTRLQHRLTEPEILHIFTDIAEGVACMHYLKPPLLHRDLKVENVLIVSHGSQKKFKVCDFGSAAPPKPAPQTVVECRLMDEDVQKHTTMQYRSPEMIDVYRKLPIDEKSDIWALGVLLYKLCYYTTPFEDQGQLAILNASYRFPSYPGFSDRLKKLIASMLRESPAARPNIYQVLREGCAMQGRDVPIHDIYTGKQRSEPQSRPAATEPAGAKPVVGAVFAPAKQEEQVLPDIVPMRRGRLPASSQQPQAQAQQAAKPSPSPMRVTNGDPFAALDTPAAATAAAAATTPAADVDEFSSRFPSLDQFSLLHESGSKFNFDSHTPPATQQQRSQPQRPAEKPVDAAFPAAHSPPKNKEPRPVSTHLESNLDFLREKEGSSKPLPSPGLMSPKFPDRVPSPAAPTEPEQEEAHIESNVEFLRSMEESKSERKEWGAKHGKRGSLSSLSGTKNILAGKFGDAFKRFEGNQAPAPARTPSPLKQLDRPTLTPIEGSEATDGRTDDGKGMEETEDMTPAMRRELERLRLEEEERRVEAAAAEYRQRFTNQSSGPGGLPKSIGGVSRAVSIQNRVQNLLNEGQKSSAQVPRTAQGYGVYTDNSPAPNRLDKQLPEIPRKPVGGAKSRSVTPSNAQDVAVHKVRPSASDPVSQTGRSTSGPRPVAPRKPMHLNSLPTGGRSGSPPKSSQAPSMSSDHLVGVGLPGRPVIEMSAREKEDYLQDFSKRFPSLGSIEMVERDLAAEAGEQRPAR